jgi:hypothetical protein
MQLVLKGPRASCGPSDKSAYFLLRELGEAGRNDINVARMTYGDKLSFHIVLNSPYFFSRVCPSAPGNMLSSTLPKIER